MQPANININGLDRKFLLSIIDSLYKYTLDKTDEVVATEEQEHEVPELQLLLTNLDLYKQVMESDAVASLPEVFKVRAWALLMVLKKEDILPPVFVMSCDAPEGTEPKVEDRWLQVSWPHKLISANLNSESEWCLAHNTSFWIFSEEEHDEALSLLVMLLKMPTHKSEGCASQNK